MHSDTPAVLRPGEAGRAIGIKPSTLRIYAQRFADLLSEDAGGSGHNGYRVFSQQDVALLRQARELLERGLTYERAASQLRGAGHGSRAPSAPAPPRERPRGRPRARPAARDPRAGRPGLARAGRGARDRGRRSSSSSCASSRPGSTPVGAAAPTGRSRAG